MSEPAPASAMAPTSAEALRGAILERYDSLSKRLKQIAVYVLDEPHEMALETLVVIAERCGVQPSTIVRFAKTFGYSGASQMQRLFRDGLLSGHEGRGYSERARQFDEAAANQPEGGVDLLIAAVEGDILALQNLAQTVSEADMAAAVTMIAEAETVYVIGFRRSFPVSAHLAHSLQESNKRAVLIDGVAGQTNQHLRAIGPKDVLIAVSAQPYAEETIQAVETASARGASILSICDSIVGPIAKPAALILHVRDSAGGALRSLAASICLVQALVKGVASESSRNKGRSATAARPVERQGR